MLLAGAAALAAGPKPLFNGKDLTGWARIPRHEGAPAGEWNTMDITIDGLRTIVHVNGVLVTDYDGVSEVPPRKQSYEPERGPRPESGYIGLQGHDDRAIIYFQEVSFAPKSK